MTTRTTSILAVIAAALLAFIVFYERELPTTDELSERSDKLLRVYTRDAVARMRVERPGSGSPSVDLARSPKSGDAPEDDLGAFDAPAWRVTSPVEDEADGDAVEAVLGALEWAAPSRRLDDVTAADRTRFGLDDPRVILTIGDEGGAETRIALGGEPPQGGGVYVALSGAGAREGDGSRVHVLGEDFFEALDQPPNHFRAKSPFRGAAVAKVDRVRIRSSLGVVDLRKQDDQALPGWRFEGRAPGHASSPRLDEVLRDLSDLEVATFVDEEPGDLADYGLAEPRVTLGLEGPADGEAARFSVEAAFGADCPDAPGQVHLRVDEGPVVCVESGVLEILGRDPEDFRERRLLPWSDDRVASVAIEVDDRTLVLSREGDAGFRWTSSRGETRLGEGPAEAAAVAGLLAELRREESDAFLPADERKIRASGLTDPAVRVRVVDHDDAAWVIAVGGRSPGGRFARRGDEEAILMIPDDLPATLTTAPTRFRSDTPVELEEDDVVGLSVIRGAGPDERTERRDDDGSATQWVLTSPVDVPGDRVAIADLIRAVASLRAARWVSETPDAAHGFGSPQGSVAWSVASEEATTASWARLVVGTDAPRDEGAPADQPAGIYVAVGEDGPVFVADRGFLDALGPLLADRSALATDRSDCESVTIERGGRTVVLELERSPAILEALGTLRARRVDGYLAEGTPLPESPLLRITVRRREGAPPPHRYTMLLETDSASSDDDPTVLVRRLDLPVRYAVSRGDLAPFLDAAP